MGKKPKKTVLSIFCDADGCDIRFKGKSALGNSRGISLTLDEWKEIIEIVKTDHTYPSYSDLYEFTSRLAVYEPDIPITVEETQEEARMIMEDLPF